MRYLIYSLAGVLLGSTAAAAAGDTADPAGLQFSHAVFFSLADNSPAARDTLVAACKKYLSGHDGTVSFSVGIINDGMTRGVNDRNFDVSLLIVFENTAAHDRYQAHPRHLQFVEENKATWKTVRVFDSNLR